MRNVYLLLPGIVFSSVEGETEPNTPPTPIKKHVGVKKSSQKKLCLQTILGLEVSDHCTETVRSYQ
jgi:hypothetical protein